MRAKSGQERSRESGALERSLPFSTYPSLALFTGGVRFDELQIR